jgi:two-component system sensor histidine kinase BaeS
MLFKKSITSKLIFLLISFSVLLASVMALATRFSFQESFLEYVTDAELAELDGMVERLSTKYQEVGSWEFVARKHQVWMSYLPEKTKSGQGQVFPPPHRERRTDLPPHQRPRPDLRPPPPPTDKSGLSTRLRLINLEGRRVIGPPDESGNPTLREIIVNGQVVGYLSLTPVPLPIEGIDERFRDDQMDTIYYIALAAILLAVIAGIPLGRRFVKPVKSIASGAHQLAQGKFETRIEPQGQDELGQLAHDFNGLASALERNEALRRQGMADISHELRTPLALIRSEIEAMQDGIRPLNLQQLGKLHGSAQQLNSLVDDLYDLALTDAGALNYRKQDIDLAEILGAAAESVEHSFSKSGLSLKVQLPTELEIFGDPKRLRQVVDNLLKNSRRYTNRNGSISLSAWQKGSQVHFTIEDSAPGVDPEILPRLFDRFYREEASRNRATGGAGLGLSICRNIVEAHQGTIEAEASELGGLKVSVTLPIEG